MTFEQGDMSYLDQFYLGGPVTPMSRAEEDEYAAWRADYRRRKDPVSEQGDVETIREALNSAPLPRRDPAEPGWKHREDALVALDRLVAALTKARDNGEQFYAAFLEAQARAERAERALAENKQAWEDMRAYNIRLEERAREAKRALAEMREWFANKPWEGDPDPSDFGGHPYTPNERAIGYGTYRDPRFLPAALRSEDTSDES